jgi:hypothetical protein
LRDSNTTRFSTTTFANRNSNATAVTCAWTTTTSKS